MPRQPGPAENDGCPVEGPLVTLESDRVRLNGSVHFDTDKAIIKPESFPLLDEVVSVLQKNPQLKQVRVEGHTDNRGTAAYNLDLSRRRAAAVLEYLVQHGIVAQAAGQRGLRLRASHRRQRHRARPGEESPRRVPCARRRHVDQAGQVMLHAGPGPR